MFREMRRFKQQLSEEECAELLRTVPRGVLSVCGDDGYPYGVPMDFVCADGKLYFHCAKEGHKLDAILRNDKVSFCIMDEGYRDAGDWALRIRSVIVFGRMRVLKDAEERITRLRQLGQKYYPDTESVESEIDRDAARAVVLELTPAHITGKRVHEK
ncbi:MAG: pyridoxamine 5'-phosphate oxidase family protein [Oscillospiraceae bacterium]|nr:pyridoxamine 5'-phosphate oxidase family protein [Oscillospiraceae bacterium]